MKTLAKKQSFAFGKNIYLLGRKDGENFWLEAPSWDCGWYWGFGYVETYTNNRCLEKSKHTHIDNDQYKYLKNFFDQTTFNEEERHELLTCFMTFYLLKADAGKYHKTDVEKYDNLVLNEIPVVMNRIVEILTPKNQNPVQYKHEKEKDIYYFSKS